jgi:hypothetical protein
MGFCEDVVCLPCKLLSSLCDALTVILCCPCRICCGCPKTASESREQPAVRAATKPAYHASPSLSAPYR